MYPTDTHIANRITARRMVTHLLKGNGTTAARATLSGQVRLAFCIIAMLFFSMPHLLPAALLVTPDAQASDAYPTQAVETPGQNFPGSAFFFAEAAFETPAQSTAQNDPHILSLAKVVAAPSIGFYGATAIDRFRAVNCLTSAIYYEAANEPDEGQRAVAQVVLNRVRHPAWPNTVCGVVYQGSERTDLRCQFTFACDGAMARLPDPEKWERARRVALRTLSGDVFAPVGMATHYHTLAVHPGWSGMDPVAVVGAHIFYIMRGPIGQPQAFWASYTRRETISGPAPRMVNPAIAPPAAMPADIPAMPVGAVTRPVTALDAQQSASEFTQLPDSNIRPEYRNSGRPLF